ncbi:hypothetical protein TRVL_08527 [Trypanosoma vivax]|nr:hypothetical protein TRVL_08527 [Trypanosoma vivax]
MESYVCEALGPPTSVTQLSERTREKQVLDQTCKLKRCSGEAHAKCEAANGAVVCSECRGFALHMRKGKGASSRERMRRTMRRRRRERRNKEKTLRCGRWRRRRDVLPATLAAKKTWSSELDTSAPKGKERSKSSTETQQSGIGAGVVRVASSPPKMAGGRRVVKMTRSRTTKKTRVV